MLTNNQTNESVNQVMNRAEAQAEYDRTMHLVCKLQNARKRRSRMIEDAPDIYYVS